MTYDCTLRGGYVEKIDAQDAASAAEIIRRRHYPAALSVRKIEDDGFGFSGWEMIPDRTIDLLALSPAYVSIHEE